MQKLTRPLSRERDLVVQELGKEILIYDLKTDKALCLNETAALVWQACDGSKSAGEIGREVSRKLNSSVPEELVCLALEQLKDEDLLANSEEMVTKFSGVSRREAIRKVGLATMVALPLISSITAPEAAAAQSASSCVGDFDPCDPAGPPCCSSGFECLTASLVDLCLPV